MFIQESSKTFVEAVQADAVLSKAFFAVSPENVDPERDQNSVDAKKNKKKQKSARCRERFRAAACPAGMPSAMPR